MTEAPNLGVWITDRIEVTGRCPAFSSQHQPFQGAQLMVDVTV